MTRATLILAVALLLIAALAESEHRRDPAPLVHAAWTQPQGRLFAVCPNDIRNYDKASGRNA